MSIPDIVMMPFGHEYESMTMPHMAYEHSVTHSVDVAVKKPKPSEVVMEAIKARLGTGIDEAFFIADLGALKRQYRKWARLLPRVVSPFDWQLLCPFSSFCQNVRTFPPSATDVFPRLLFSAGPPLCYQMQY